MNTKTLDEKLENWQERIADKSEAEAEQAKQEAEKLRQSYLRRTGRDQMKP